MAVCLHGKGVLVRLGIDASCEACAKSTRMANLSLKIAQGSRSMKGQATRTCVEGRYSPPAGLLGARLKNCGPLDAHIVVFGHDVGNGDFSSRLVVQGFCVWAGAICALVA